MEDSPLVTSKEFADVFGKMIHRQILIGGDRRELINQCAQVLAVLSIADATQQEAEINVDALTDGIEEGVKRFASFMERAQATDGKERV